MNTDTLHNLALDIAGLGIVAATLVGILMKSVDGPTIAILTTLSGAYLGVKIGNGGTSATVLEQAAQTTHNAAQTAAQLVATTAAATAATTAAAAAATTAETAPTPPTPPVIR